MKSYLLSTLALRFAHGPLADFERTHPHDWLVWEPSPWAPPTATTQKLPRVPTPLPGPAPVHMGDCLAIALDSATHAPQLTLGRSPDCDITLSDGTLSSVHLVFMRAQQGTLWTVRDANSRNGTSLDGIKLAAGQPAVLRSGAQLVAAQLQLTYLTPSTLFTRLKPS